MYSNFSAHGTVLDKEVKESRQGNPYAVFTIKVGEYQGNPEMLQVTLAGKSFAMSQQASKGDEVAVSGFLRSKRKDNGYWDVDVRVMSLVTTRKAQGGYQQQSAPAYSDIDIPWE